MSAGFPLELPGLEPEEATSLVPFGGLSRVDEQGEAVSVHQGEYLFGVQSEVAAEIADLISIELDMQHALDYATRYPEFEDDGDLAGALYAAAVITYGRSFRQGRSAQARKGQHGKGAPRLKATAFLSALSAELLALHEELLELRDKHVGHRVDHETSAVVAEFDGEGRFLYASPLLWNLGSSGRHMAAVREIVEVLLPLIHEEIHAKTQTVERVLSQFTVAPDSRP